MPYTITYTIPSICFDRKGIIFICLLLALVLFTAIFILWTYVSYHVLKWLKKNIEEKLYYNSYKECCIITLEKYGDLPIKRIYLVRTNVNTFLTFLLDLVTWKSYSAQVRDYRKIVDDAAFFPSHTYMIVEVELGNKRRKHIIIEKTNGIEVTANFRKYESQDMLKVNLKNGHNLTINKILETTKERIGNQQFFNWHLYKNNCQQFMEELMKSTRKSNPRYKDFVSHPKFFEIIKISDPVMYMMNSALNLKSFIESIYFDLTL